MSAPRWEENPMGEMYCRAPCYPPCDRSRSLRAGRRLPTGALQRATFFPFCHGHAKRKARGKRIDTPLLQRRA